MSFDALNSITNAEEKANQIVADAESKARQIISDAEENGKVVLAKAQEEAKAEKGRIFDEANESIAANDAAFTEESNSGIGTLRHKALKNIEEAANLVVERIVKG